MKSYYPIKGKVIHNQKDIPADMIPHTDDKNEYPNGIEFNTVVDVIISFRDKTFLYRGYAQTFGWSIKPIPSSVPGAVAESAPITHYRIVKESING